MKAMRTPIRILAHGLLAAGILSSLHSLIAQQRTKAQTGSSTQAGELSQQLSAEVQADLGSGNFAGAESALVKLSSLNPGVAEIQANLGAVYFQEGKIRAAADSLRKALRLKPTLTKSKTLLAICLAELGESKQALPGLDACFHGAVDAESKRRCGLELLRAYSAMHRDAQAVTTALALNTAYPDDAEILYQTGRIYGNFAFLTMEKLRDKDPNSIWMLQASAEAAESQENYDEAIRRYNAVLRIEPRRPGIHYRMGRVYLARFEGAREEKERNLAAEQFRAELAIDPENGNAAYELAQIEHDTGNVEQAQQDFEALLVVRPDFEQALVGLAGTLIEMRKPELAVPRLQHAIAIDSNDEVAWYRMARALHMVGDLEGQKKALVQFERLHKLQSGKQAHSGAFSSAGEVTPQQVGPND
jgi:tetratricopeptide (TPR) repeat protein